MPSQSAHASTPCQLNSASGGLEARQSVRRAWRAAVAAAGQHDGRQQRQDGSTASGGGRRSRGDSAARRRARGRDARTRAWRRHRGPRHAPAPFALRTSCAAMRGDRRRVRADRRRLLRAIGWVGRQTAAPTWATPTAGRARRSRTTRIAPIDARPRLQRGAIVNLPNVMPRSQPSPVPASASDTSPFVIACAPLDLLRPAWASAVRVAAQHFLDVVHAGELAGAVVDLRLAEASGRRPWRRSGRPSSGRCRR